MWGLGDETAVAFSKQPPRRYNRTVGQLLKEISLFLCGSLGDAEILLQGRADKSLARPVRKQATVFVRMA